MIELKMVSVQSNTDGLEFVFLMGFVNLTWHHCNAGSLGFEFGQ